MLLALIGEDGVPGAVRAISDDIPKYSKVYSREFRAAAIEAVEAWRYEPARRDGRAVAFPVTIDLRFSSE